MIILATKKYEKRPNIKNMFVSISDMKNNVTKIKLMYNIMWHKIEKNTEEKHEIYKKNYYQN